MQKHHDMGPIGECICPKCGSKIPHQRNVPCQEERCPHCGAKMLREGSHHHRLWEQKHKKIPGSSE